MRLLLDENLPLDLAVLLAGHQVSTVRGLGWQGLRNGELLQRASGLTDCLLTMDRSIGYGQNIAALSFGILLVRARSNRMADLVPLAPGILAAVRTVSPGRLVQIP
jgi:predicted nuclease of predicted toxin-antitoxin system